MVSELFVLLVQKLKYRGSEARGVKSVKSRPWKSSSSFRRCASRLFVLG